MWWLVLAGLPAVWILLRTLLDVRECRLSTALLVAAILCYVVSAVSLIGWVPTGNPRLDVTVTNATVLLGHWLILATSVSQARFVILDAQGLIPIRSRAVRKETEERLKSDASEGTKELAPAARTYHSSDSDSEQRQSMRRGRDDDRTRDDWVDGSQPENDSYDNDSDSTSDDRKLSKSERKRMRKLKAQHRAA
jgi:hypothetical protein